MAYISVELPKFRRERYILVAAMEIAINEAIMNICVQGRIRIIGIHHERSNEEHTPSNGAGISKTVNGRYYNVGRRETFTIQTQTNEHLQYRQSHWSEKKMCIRNQLDVPLAGPRLRLQSRAK
jgi:hypothetical protein